VLSSNEELQSTNEQLGTAKEELQSTNEELQTLNEELQTRNTELNQLNNDLGNLLGSVQIPILMLGNDLRVRRFNSAAVELLNLKPAIVGRPVHAIDSPLIVREFEHLYLEAMSKVAAKEIEVRDRDGHWYSLRLNPYRTEDNRIDGVIMALVDIEALKRLQEIQNTTAKVALTESEERFRNVADSAPVLIWISDPGRLYTWFNKPWLEFTGRTMEQESGKGWMENLHPDDLPKYLETCVKEFEARRGFKMEYRLRRHDGEYRWLLDQGVPRYHTTEFVGYIGSCVDITDQKSAEKHLVASLEREKAGRAIAERATRAKDDFLAALSHELRTPLNPVLLIASDAVNDHELSPRTRADFETIRKNIELESRLIDDLLDSTRITSGKLSLNMQILDVHLVLQDAISNCRAEADAKQLAINLGLKAEQRMVRGDSVRLQQVFWNVLKNAVKFTPAGGKIEIETYSDNGQWVVKINDTGIGMIREELMRVFSAFAQGDHVRRESHRFGGLGLGLDISRRLVELHSGHIHAASEGRDQGSSFIIELPLAQIAAENATPSKSAPTDSLFQRKIETRGTRVLLIEDHEATRNTLTHLLVSRHYKVLAAGSIAAAREIADKEKIDFVISDIGLPDGDGNDLMKELGESYGLKGIALTGYGMEEDIKHSLTAGFVAHLTKPINVQSLENVLATPALTIK
jgi:PAS domain S-box-containing protein